MQCSNWTYPGTSCTLLGKYNAQAGMIPQLVANFDKRWPLGTPFLAGYLQQAGYYSVLASTNGWLSEAWGNTSGYDHSFHPKDNSAIGAYTEARSFLDFQAREGKVEDWFLHVHTTEPHASYAPPERFLGALDDLTAVPWDLTDRDEHYDVARSEWPAMTEAERSLLEQHLRLRYEGEIAYMDEQIFQIVSALDFEGMLDDTLLVFWTDHGEQFWEHDSQTHAHGLYRGRERRAAVHVGQEHRARGLRRPRLHHRSGPHAAADAGAADPRGPDGDPHWIGGARPAPLRQRHRPRRPPCRRSSRTARS